MRERKSLEELIKKVPICMAHASNTIKPNEDFILAKEVDLAISFTSEDEIIKTSGTIILKLNPNPRLVILVCTDLKTSFDNHKQASILEVSTQYLKFRCRITSLTTNNLGESNATLTSIDKSTLHKDVTNLKYVTFYVLNFPESFGESVRGRNNPKFTWLSRLMFSDEQWCITLDKAEDYKTIFDELKAKDGYSFSYAGKIERNNSESFSSEQIHQVLHKVHNFLSFARGANTTPFYLMGYDKDDILIWKDWSLRRCDRWTLTQDNWFCDQHSVEQLKELYPKWSRLFEDELWKDELPKILYWYFYAGRNTEGAGTDGSLILAVAALELFSFNYLVRKTKLRSKEKFERKQLSNNIFKTLDKLGIPIQLPKQFEKLHKYCIGKDWQTGPKAIVELRNEIVHPDRESAPPSSIVCYEALQLALWYIELLVLRLSNYEGLYSNRLRRPKWRGEVEKVPYL